MLELLAGARRRSSRRRSEELRRKFRNFDIECVDVLIGKPDTAEAGGKIETLLEQLRLRQLSLEQIETYAKQVTAAEKLRALNEAQATAAMQTELTNSLVQVQIVENEAEAELAKARKEAEQMVVTAQAESQQRILAGRGEGARILQDGLSEASVLAPQDPVVLRPAALRPVGRRPEPGPEQPAAGARARLHRRRRRGQRPRRRRPAGRPSGATAGTRPPGHAAQPAGRREIGLRARRALPGGTCSRSSPTRSRKQAMENIQEAMAAGAVTGTSHGVGNGGANLNLEVADPTKSVAAAKAPKAEPKTLAPSGA